jgi:hypothetical protein
MAEPTTSAAAATAVAVAAAVPPLMVWGISTGLRPDMLIAGFLGSIASMVMLNSVPSTGDTLAHMVRTSFKRMATAAASSATSGYVAPLALLPMGLSDGQILGAAFLVGVFAQRFLLFAGSKITPPGGNTQ